jgi:hypothetical protein
MSWTNLPSYEDIAGLLRTRAAVTANIRVLELQIQIAEARISLEHPRNTAIRVVGNESHDILSLRDALIDRKNQLDELEAEIKLFDYQKDVFKTLSYRERA